MAALRASPTSTVSDPHHLSPARICSLSSDGRSSIATLGPDRAVIALPGAPDPSGAGAATLGLRRVHHVIIEVHPAGVTCTAAGITRTPVHRRVTLGTALALAGQGVPTFVADRTGG